MNPTRRRRSRGQAVAELALAFPVLILIVLGGMDLAQAYRFGNDAQGAARAGMLTATRDNSSDIGDAIRQEPSNVVSTGAWGNEDSGGSRAHCKAGDTACGDANGCPASSFISGQTACFAVRGCQLSSSAKSAGNFACTSFDPWGQRPAVGAGEGIQVVVVFAYKPYTPLIGSFGTNGVFYITATAEGLQLY